ncbi:hypothetical protein [Roseivirga thermotolerans]|uniref:hypothetical protein n=1 Tax=Roseivirga thermotolerans TaxID=1758176 RepID=UPI00273FED1C|nr:hypothetical protein [Roseivirga thermotolerans]
MAYPIEILSIGNDLYNKVEKVVSVLNSKQEEFIFLFPPIRIRNKGFSFIREEYNKSELFEFIEQYRLESKGFRPYIIAIVDGKIEGNIFGSTHSKDGIAFFNFVDRKFLNSQYAYIAYYLIRYTLGFIQPIAKTHPDTRGCFFDYKGFKPEIKDSVRQMKPCDEHMRVLQPMLNEEIFDSLILKLGKSVKKMESLWWFYEVVYLLKSEKNPNSQRNVPWVITTLIISLVISIVALYLTKSFDASLISFVVFGLVIFFRNPKWRFFRLGSSLLGMAGLTSLPKITSSLSINLPEKFNFVWGLLIDQTYEVQIGLVISGTILIILDFIKNR